MGLRGGEERGRRLYLRSFANELFTFFSLVHCFTFSLSLSHFCRLSSFFFVSPPPHESALVLSVTKKSNDLSFFLSLSLSLLIESRSNLTIVTVDRRLQQTDMVSIYKPFSVYTALLNASPLKGLSLPFLTLYSLPRAGAGAGGKCLTI